MPVISLTNILEDFEGGVSFTNIGGGQGATTNTDVVIEGNQSGARRASNQTLYGFSVNFTPVDMTAANTHIKAWAQVLQWGLITILQIRVSDGTNNDDHTLPSTQYPDLGGFTPVWIDVARTPEVGGSANKASISRVGILITIPTVGGNAQNLILDAITVGTSGLRWEGSGGSFADFETFEATNRDGVLVTNQGVYFCYARIEIGSAVATTFTNTGFQLVFPDQTLISETFMGLTVDLQNASTDVSLTNSVITSSNVAAATRRFDVVVTGTSGSFELLDMNVTGARLLSFNTAVEVIGGTYQTISLVQGGALIEDCTIQTNAPSGVATLADPTFDPVTGLHDVRFVQAGLGHAIEIPGTTDVTLTNLSFSGYGADTTNSAALFFSATTGTITVNLSGTPQPTFRTAGVTVVFVAAYNLILTGIPEDVQVTLVESTTRDELFNVITTGANVTYTHGGGDTVDILFNSLIYDPLISDIYDLVLGFTDQTIPITMFEDRNYIGSP